MTETSLRRPALVTWLSVGVITLATVQLGGIAAGLSLPDLPYSVPIVYLVVRNSAWSLWAYLAALGAFFGKTWAPRVLRWGGAMVLAWFWADRLFLTRSGFAKSSWPLAAGVSGLAVGLVLFILSRQSARRYFRENDS